MGSTDIDWFYLAIGYSMLLIPVFILSYFKTGLTVASLWAAFRMTVQLLFIGFYLEVIFKIDDIKINLAWFIIMVIVAGFTIIKRAEVNKFFIIPVLTGLIAGLTLTLVFIFLFVLRLENPFTATYLIPLSGMILGNCLNTSIVGIRAWHSSLTKEKNLYIWYLSCAATQTEALKPFVKKALQEAFSPAIATMATIGLVALPGMMTGQILGGSNPVTAIKYQILIMICILTATIITVTCSILVSRYFFFDESGMPKL